jgi:serine/threonine-protein kinase
VNEAVMRGMAIEPQFRPTTVAEWLQMLPVNGLNVISPILPTQAVPTINLSGLKSKDLHKKATPLPVSTPSIIKKVPAIKQKASVPKGVIGISIALVAATAGFSMIRTLSKSDLESSPKPLVEQTTYESNTPKPVVEISPSPESENESQKTQTSYSRESTPVRSSRRRRKNVIVSPEPTPTSNSSYEEKAPEDNSQPTPTPDTTTEKSTPVVTSSPSLVDTLREAKESQKTLPPVPKNTVPESNQNQVLPPSSPESRPVVIPQKESQPANTSSVEVPTQETNQNQAPENQPQKAEKPPQKVENQPQKVEKPPQDAEKPPQDAEKPSQDAKKPPQ